MNMMVCRRFCTADPGEELPRGRGLQAEKGIKSRVLPGVSSVQLLAARLGRPWQDWTLCSAHGTDCDVVAAVMEGKPAFFLTGGALGPAELCRRLTEAGLGDLNIKPWSLLTDKTLNGRYYIVDKMDIDYRSNSIKMTIIEKTNQYN